MCLSVGYSTLCPFESCEPRSLLGCCVLKRRRGVLPLHLLEMSLSIGDPANCSSLSTSSSGCTVGCCHTRVGPDPRPSRLKLLNLRQSLLCAAQIIDCSLLLVLELGVLTRRGTTIVGDNPELLELVCGLARDGRQRQQDLTKCGTTCRSSDTSVT